MTGLILSRMDLDDVGYNPITLADAIHEQLGNPAGPVPVPDIALALDIQEIRHEEVTNLEGALLTDKHRGTGSILVNANSNRQRQRFTISHELYHFLNPWHVPVEQSGFVCTQADMIIGPNKEQTRHRRQEADANQFAIEILTPRQLVRRYLDQTPDLSHPLNLAKSFDISREASARRYVELHPVPLAVVFARNNQVLYTQRNDDFPWIALSRGDQLPELAA